MTPRSLIHRRENSAVDFLTGGDSYPVASGFLGRYHHQIIVCIYFNGRFLYRRKVANHDENPKKAHPKMGKYATSHTRKKPTA
ncbi:hypothetical protein EOW31_11400 [Salmonella enterica]|uniref:Uncharacterized protein n=1 Tax=Salmonella derby TaxID=28144 RepID=A0A3W0B024_SALDE|nr:hypothetical protein [Salmonella enterica subsp. enterica serovar Derby]EAM9753038.1 hypothetical protein [Salmonella enterica]ECI3991922.1 hypothetical protein [Salmonella enterica subsp. enterica]ECS3153472.1 hypothetical protein [Salmonella enterica subsp. enterica serovar 4,[5],12:i:-]EAQ8855444.1 hypothetical protein [Salmonella enterica]